MMIGQVLSDRYEILEKTGEGGMAVAYRGRDRVLGRAVAVKVMRPELAADAEFLARFRREARAAAGIIHEHIAAVYDTGSDGPYHYIVMEFVSGESLKARLQREGPLSLEAALTIATATAEALEAAHSAGVIHRDIKPHNILLGSEGQVKVTDFGIARAMSATGNTETGVILGSVNYVSPEQARGEAVGPQSDVYSLGIMLFETLTGRPPFDGGERLAIVHKHIYDRAPRPSTLRPGLPHEVDSLVVQCLEKDLSKRFASAAEVLNYLAACPREETQAWRPGARRERWRRALSLEWLGPAWRVRRRAFVTALLVAVMAVALVAVTLWAASRGRGAVVRVPDVVGMSGSAGEQQLKQARLDYRVLGRRESEDTAVGAILSQDPAANEEVPPGSVVKVVLSEGPKSAVVPNVTRMSVAQAKKQLQLNGLEPGLVQDGYDDHVPASYVANSLPPPGSRVVRGTAVDLVVSKGPRPAMPPGPPLPALPKPERDEKLDFTVPADVGAGEAEVTVELVTGRGARQTLYVGRHRANEKIPTQTIAVREPVTARVLVNGQLRAEHRFEPDESAAPPPG